MQWKSYKSRGELLEDDPDHYSHQTPVEKRERKAKKAERREIHSIPINKEKSDRNKLRTDPYLLKRRCSFLWSPSTQRESQAGKAFVPPLQGAAEKHCKTPTNQGAVQLQEIVSQ